MDEATLFAKTLTRFTPDQAGALWIGILLVIVVAGDFRNIFSRRNGLLAILLLPALPLMDIMVWGFGRQGDPLASWLLGAAFSVLFTLTAFIAAIALYLAFRKPDIDWSINLPTRGLRVLLAVVVIINIIVVLGRPGEDSGPYTSMGAQRWLETGTMPYGDPLLRGPDAPGYGAAATYGPLLYVAHMPLQLLMGPPWNDPGMEPKDKAYVLPSQYVTKLTCLAFQLLALYSLFAIGRRYASENIGLSMAILYAGSPYVMGLGSDTALVGGLPYISHIAPTAMILLTMLFLSRPLIAGIMLAGAVGILFWPVFLFPLFFGWYFWQRAGVGRFTTGFAGTGAAIAIMVIYFTGSIGDQGPIDLLISSTLEHQEGVGEREYGATSFSFWGTHPALASFWQQPIFGDTSIFKPSFILFLALSVSSFLLVRGRDRAQLALLVVVLAAAIQLWKTNAGGTYVEWYLPFLLIGIFCSLPAGRKEPEPTSSG
jgi:hypothetical protein